MYFSHHYTSSPADAVAAITHAGTDVDCGGFMGKYAQSALDNATVTVADFDVLLVRLFKVRIRLGYFDPDGPLQTIGADQVCTPAALELARDGVRQSAVLLKNTPGAHALPLSASAYASAVVIGPNMALTDTFTCVGVGAGGASPSRCLLRTASASGPGVPV